MSTIHRTIKAILYPNPMKNAKGSYLARTSKHITYNIREICESAKEKTGIVNADALEYHVKLFFEEMLALIEDGNKINTGYFTAQANVKGTFNSTNDNFDAERHSVDIVFSSSYLTRQRAKKLKAEILHIEPFNYGIRKVTDGQTKLDIGKLVANRLLVISGDKVKVVGNDPSVGVYFILTESGSETHLRPTELYENGNAAIKLFVPELTSGTYQLKIITQYSGNTIPLIQTRSLCYPYMLHVD
jgi:hypothetical protein